MISGLKLKYLNADVRGFHSADHKQKQQAFSVSPSTNRNHNSWMKQKTHANQTESKPDTIIFMSSAHMQPYINDSWQRTAATHSHGHLHVLAQLAN